MAKYFVYSRMQQKEQDKNATSINKKYVPGTVYTKGVYKPYTEILSAPKSRYSDSVIVLTSDSDTLNDVNYTEFKFETR